MTVGDLVTVAAFVLSTGGALVALHSRSRYARPTPGLPSWSAGRGPARERARSRPRTERRGEPQPRRLPESRTQDVAPAAPVVCEVRFCVRCASFWIVVRRPEATQKYGPPSGGCEACNPHDESAGNGRDAVAVTPADSAAERAMGDEGVKFLADALAADPERALAEHVVERLGSAMAGDVRAASSADNCRGLNAVAEALDNVREGTAETSGRAVVVLAEIMGTPELLAQLFGELARRVVAAKLEPLRTLSLTIRAAGVASCQSVGEEERCACRDPLWREVAEEVATELATKGVKQARERLQPAATDDVHGPREQQPEEAGKLGRTVGDEGPAVLEAYRSKQAGIEPSL